MKFSRASLIICGTIILSSIATADGPQVQHQFSGGQPASASQVNENFQELANRIQDNADILASFDYRDFSRSNNITGKTFIHSNATPEECDTQNRSYTNTPQNTDTLIVENLTFTGGIDCTNTLSKHEYLATDTGIVRRKITSYDDNAGTNINSETIYNEGLLLRTTNMRVGHTWGAVSSTTISDNLAFPQIINQLGGNRIELHSLLAIEDVEVPYDGGRGDNNPTTYSNCLKIARSNTFGANSASISIRWYCGGLGIVKIMFSGRTWELANITTI